MELKEEPKKDEPKKSHSIEVSKEIDDFKREIEDAPWLEEKVVQKQQEQLEEFREDIDNLKDFELKPGSFEAFCHRIEAEAKSQRKLIMTFDEDFKTIKKELEELNPFIPEYTMEKIIKMLMENRVRTSMLEMGLTDTYKIGFRRTASMLLTLSNILEDKYPVAFKSMFGKRHKIEETPRLPPPPTPVKAEKVELLEDEPKLSHQEEKAVFDNTGQGTVLASNPGKPRRITTKRKKEAEENFVKKITERSPHYRRFGKTLSQMVREAHEQGKSIIDIHKETGIPMVKIENLTSAMVSQGQIPRDHKLFERGD